MAYSEELDDRVERFTASWGNTARKRMFGGVCHLLDGNMFAGVLGESLILRLGDEAAVAALRSPGVRPFDLTGRPMRGWVVVDPPAFAGDEALGQWLDHARSYVKTLPTK